MNPARLAELHRERAALQGKLAAVDREIAAALEEPEPAPAKAKRPPYVAPSEVAQIDLERATGAFREAGYDVRSLRRPRQGQDGPR